MIALERRAATALYRMLRAQREPLPWIVPVNACPVVAWCFQAAGVPIQLVDVDPGTLLLSEDRTLEVASRERMGGMLFIRTYGCLDDRSAFFRRVRDVAPEIVIVDDRAVCEPEAMLEPPPGIDAVLFSTGPRKPVDLGWGGLCVMRSGLDYDGCATAFALKALEEVDARSRQAIGHGEPFSVSDAAWLDARKVTDEEANEWERRLPGAIDAARELRAIRSAIYRETIPAESQLGAAYDTWRFQIRVRDSENLVRALFAAGMFASRHYPSLGRSLQPGQRFPVAERLEREVVNLFNDRHVTEAMARRTAEIVARHVALNPFKG